MREFIARNGIIAQNDSIIIGSLTVAEAITALNGNSTQWNTAYSWGNHASAGYAGLGVDGKLISSQLPSITISDTFVVASQAAMLALTLAEKGDVAVRTDLNKSFILKGALYSTLADWQELLTPTSSVTTVFGRNGAVTASSGDYTADQITSTATKVFVTPAEKTAITHSNREALNLVSGTNTGDQTLAGLGGIGGSGTTNYISKFTSGTALGNSQIFDNGTNVGIGTTSPSEKLHVVGNGKFTGTVTHSDATLATQSATLGQVNTLLTGYSSTAHTHTFASLTSKPTTLAGYGITDGGGSGAATIIDDLIPPVVSGGTWYQPTEGILSVGIDDAWVEVGRNGSDGMDGADGAIFTAPTTTKGDIFVFGTSNSRLPVGTNNQVLTADSSLSLGLKWANASTTVIDDIAPTVVSGGFWFNPLSSSMHVGVGSAWVSIIGESGIDGVDGTNGTSVTAASGTGTVLSLTEIGGYYYNMASANSSTTYTTTGTTLGTFACVLINAATEPVVTGATKIKGSNFIANTNMHMWVQYFGVTVQYFFTEL